MAHRSPRKLNGHLSKYYRNTASATQARQFSRRPGRSIIPQQVQIEKLCLAMTTLRARNNGKCVCVCVCAANSEGTSERTRSPFVGRPGLWRRISASPKSRVVIERSQLWSNGPVDWAIFRISLRKKNSMRVLQIQRWQIASKYCGARNDLRRGHNQKHFIFFIYHSKRSVLLKIV